MKSIKWILLFLSGIGVYLDMPKVAILCVICTSILAVVEGIFYIIFDLKETKVTITNYSKYDESDI